MTTDLGTHFVFVDFENVPAVDLGLVEGKAVQVTLLLGKHQKKLEVPLVREIMRLGAQVQLIEVGASGPNALDLTLAYYLGQAVQRSPGAQFCIVSKDKDFEPMIGHLHSKNVRVARYESFAVLPFLPKPAKPDPIKAAVPARSGAPLKAVVPVKAGAPDVRLEKLVARLKNNSAPRPKNKSRLRAHISTAFGGRLSETEQTQKLDELISRGVLTIDAKDKVSYA